MTNSRPFQHRLDAAPLRPLIQMVPTKAVVPSDAPVGQTVIANQPHQRRVRPQPQVIHRTAPIDPGVVRELIDLVAMLSERLDRLETRYPLHD